MAPITKDFLKSAGLFCLFLSLQLIIPFLALGLSQIQVFHGAQFNLPGIEGKLLAITIPAMAFSFFIVQLAYVLLLHFTGWARIKLFSGKSANFGFSGMPILHFTGAFVVMSLGLGLMLQPLKMDDGNSVALLRQLTTNIWGILSVTIVGTLAEELTYRAGILRLTQKHIGNIGAFILSSLMFAVVHGNLQQGVPAFILGFALAYLYVRTEDLRLCWAAHLANNVIALLTIRIPALEHFGDSWPIPQQVGIGALMFILGAVGLLMKGSLLKKLFGRAKK